MDQNNGNVISKLDSSTMATKTGVEYWTAREIKEILGYQRWDRFEDVIRKAIMACDSAGIDSSYQFSKTGRLIEHAKGGKRTVDDYFLTRYACYLIAMNGDASKPQIAVAQTYFAIQTRRQELSDQRAAQEARLEIRERVRSANKALNSAAKDAGVTRYPFFHDAGYKGLYGGIGNNDIKRYKGIPKNENLLDRSGRAELAANEFRITQTEEKLRHENVLGQVHAEKTHRTVGDHIRETIKKLGGTPPEDLPSEPSIRKLSAQRKSKKLTGLN